MPLPQSEQERLEQEREFQARLLAALEKPPINRFFRVINSPSFLWAMTAIFIVLGSAYLNAYQSCVADANAVIDTYLKIEKELSERENYVRSAVNRAKNVVDIANSLHDCRSFYKEFKEHSSRELRYNFHQLQARVVISVGEAANRRALRTLEEATPMVLGDTEKSKYRPLSDCEMPLNFEEADLVGAKGYVNSDPFRHIWNHLGTFLPDCSMSNVLFERLFGHREKVVRYEPIWILSTKAKSD